MDLTVKQYADKMGVSKQSVYGKIKRGTLNTFKRDGTTYITIDEQEIEQHIKQDTNNLLNDDLMALKDQTIDILKGQLIKYENMIDKLENENRELRNNLLSGQDDFKRFTFEFMEHYKQSIEYKEHQSENDIKEHYEAEIVEENLDRNERKQELQKKYQKKGLSKKKIKAKIAKKLHQEYGN